jgi:hypothetical protein
MKKYSLLLVLAAVLALCFVLVIACGPEKEEARGAPLYYGSFVAADSDDYVKLWDGADFTMYSDEDTTSVFAIDGATGAMTAVTMTMSGQMDMNGSELVMDADGDSSLTADTDDQLDVALGGADIVVMKQWGASSIVTDTTTHLVEIQDATPIITGGTVSLAGLNVDMGIGNSTGGTNSIYGVLVDGITQDAQNTEIGISVGAGWDVGLDVNGLEVTLDADSDTSLTASTDDQLDFEIGGADEYVMSAGNFDINDSFLDQDIGVENLGGLPSVITATVPYTPSTGTVATVADGEIWFVDRVLYLVGTNFDCTGDDCTVDIGDGNDADGLLNCGDGDVQTTFADYTGAPAGWGGLDGSAPAGVYQVGGPHVYAPSGSAETIDYAIGGTDPAAGSMTVYVFYRRLQ